MTHEASGPSLEERRLALDERKQALEESWQKKWSAVIIGAAATIAAAIISAGFGWVQHNEDEARAAGDAKQKHQDALLYDARAAEQQRRDNDRQAINLYFQYMADGRADDPDRPAKAALIASIASTPQLLLRVILPQIDSRRSQGETPSDAARGLPNLIQPKAQYEYTDFVGYVQYAHGDDAAHQAANRLQAEIQSLGMTAPGVQGVQSVPNVNQIRIYRPQHRGLAANLAQALSKQNLGAYCVTQVPNPSALPNGIVELWIGKAPFAGTPGAAC